MKTPDLEGLIAATVTPMKADYSVDEPALRRYVHWIADQGVTGLAVNVDTGEGPHLYPEERRRVLEVAVEEVGDRVTIVAGLPGAFTDQAANAASEIARIGADALLVFPLAAYQGVPLDPEIPVRFHQAVAEASDLPLIAFQLQPALGGVNFPADVLGRLLDLDSVVAIKEASFDAKRFVETARVVESTASDVVLLNGNDNFLLEAYLLGARGALLGFGTLAARGQVDMLEAVRHRDFDRAFSLGERLQALCDVVFAPPVSDYRARTKHALRSLDVLPEAHVRPPLLPLSQEEQRRVDVGLKEAGML